MSSVRNLGRVSARTSALFLCDMQEKFRKSIQYFPQIINVSNRMLKGAQALNMPVIVTEQYPQGLGPTVRELDISQCKVFAKTQFSMVVSEVEKHLNQFPDRYHFTLNWLHQIANHDIGAHALRLDVAQDVGTEVRSVLLCGIETQACVLQTTLDLLHRNLEVHIVADAVSSRTMVDRMFALERIRNAGGYVTTSESLLLMLCRDATHPKFKDIQKLIRDPAPDSGLLGGWHGGDGTTV